MHLIVGILLWWRSMDNMMWKCVVVQCECTPMHLPPSSMGICRFFLGAWFPTSPASNQRKPWISSTSEVLLIQPVFLPEFLAMSNVIPLGCWSWLGVAVWGCCDGRGWYTLGSEVICGAEECIGGTVVALEWSVVDPTVVLEVFSTVHACVWK